MKLQPVVFSLAACALLTACGARTSSDGPPAAAPDGSPVAIPHPETPAAGPRCFLKARNRDTTRVRLDVAGDSVHGTMQWLPWEKDGARGTLAGVKTNSGELDLLYRYTIEGVEQTETKLMKLDGRTLRLKTGELEDPSNDGHLRYKDAAKATYTEALDAVPCP